MLMDLFITFLMIGAVSFGGGYAMLPVMEREIVSEHGWMTLQQFTDAVAIAGMSPGPIATNAAIYVGYHTAGLSGAIVSMTATILPALLLILLVSFFFYKIRNLTWVQNGFYGLRPMIAGLVFYAAFTFAAGNGLLAKAFSAQNIVMLIIFFASLLALLRFRVHPVIVIIVSGIVGMAVYG
jgi:chromate transporter